MDGVRRYLFLSQHGDDAEMIYRLRYFVWLVFTDMLPVKNEDTVIEHSENR